MPLKKRWNLKSIAKELFVTLVMFFIISLVLNHLRKPEITESIYDYDFVDTHGKVIELSSYRGEPLVVHFWGTWCPTCRLEASNIERISKEYNLLSIAVNSGENSAIEAFMKKRGLTYRVINDSTGELADKFNIEVYPTTLLYDANGTLRFSEVGYSTTLGLKARLELID